MASRDKRRGAVNVARPAETAGVQKETARFVVAL